MSKIILDGITVTDFLQRIEQLIDFKISTQNDAAKALSPFMTRKEVASLLRITLPTLHDWTKEGLIKSHKIGNRVLYKLDEIYEATADLRENKHKKLRQ